MLIYIAAHIRRGTAALMRTEKAHDLLAVLREIIIAHGVDVSLKLILIARDQKEMNEMIDVMTDEQFAENCENVMNWFGTCESGHSAEDVCRWIDGKYRVRHKA